MEDPAVAGSGTLGTGQVLTKSPERARQHLHDSGSASPLQGLHLCPIEPRVPAGFAASTLGFTVPRFQRSLFLPHPFPGLRFQRSESLPLIPALSDRIHRAE